MAKIVSMSSGAIDPIAQSKRVFWRPETPATVAKVGQPVCYDSNCVHDHKERTSDPTHLGLTDDTYAEGAQDFTGRLFVVEEPLADNLHAFAGVVKCLGPKAGADGDMIEIYVPNGAIVPVYAGISVTNDTSILAIASGLAYLGNPTAAANARPVAIAKETYDRSTAGLVWAKLCPSEFIYQSKQGTALSIGGSASTQFGRIDITTSATAGIQWGLQLKMTQTGTTSGGLIALRVTAEQLATGTLSSNVYGAWIQADCGEGGVISAGQKLCGLWTKAWTHASAGTFAGDMYGIQISLGLNKAVSGTVALMYFDTTTTIAKKPDYFFKASHLNDLNGAACQGDHTILTEDLVIPIRISGTTYYLLALKSIPNE